MAIYGWFTHQKRGFSITALVYPEGTGSKKVLSCLCRSTSPCHQKCQASTNIYTIYRFYLHDFFLSFEWFVYIEHPWAAHPQSWLFICSTTLSDKECTKSTSFNIHQHPSTSATASQGFHNAFFPGGPSSCTRHSNFHREPGTPGQVPRGTESRRESTVFTIWCHIIHDGSVCMVDWC